MAVSLPLILLVVLALVSDARANQPIARVSKFVGEVFVRSQTTPPAGQWRKVTAAPHQLFNGDEIRTERGRAEILYPNDDAIRVLERSVVRLTAGEIERRRFLFFRRKVFLRALSSAFGKLWSHVTTDKENEVEFRSPVAVVSVRGTELEFHTDKESGVTFVGVGKGVVAVTAQGVTVLASSHQAITVDPGQPPSNPFGYEPPPAPVITASASQQALARPPQPLEGATPVRLPPGLVPPGGPMPMLLPAGGQELGLITSGTVPAVSLGETGGRSFELRQAAGARVATHSFVGGRGGGSAGFSFPFKGFLISESFLAAGDDTSHSINLSGFSFPFFGQSYGSIFVNSNGSITFGTGDASADAISTTVSSMLAGPPRIAAFRADLDFRTSPFRSFDGKLKSWQRTTSYTATYFDVGSFNVKFPSGASAHSTFQITLYNTGVIQLDYNGFVGPVQGPDIFPVNDRVIVMITPGGSVSSVLSVDLSTGGISSNSQQSIVEQFLTPVTGASGSFDLGNTTLLLIPNDQGGYDIKVSPLLEPIHLSPVASPFA